MIEIDEKKWLMHLEYLKSRCDYLGDPKNDELNDIRRGLGDFIAELEPKVEPQPKQYVPYNTYIMWIRHQREGYRIPIYIDDLSDIERLKGGILMCSFTAIAIIPATQRDFYEGEGLELLKKDK